LSQLKTVALLTPAASADASMDAPRAMFEQITFVIAGLNLVGRPMMPRVRVNDLKIAAPDCEPSMAPPPGCTDLSCFLTPWAAKIKRHQQGTLYKTPAPLRVLSKTAHHAGWWPA
jgi:hypothetical protein